MTFTADACQHTVSIIYAIFFGARNACIDVGLTSLLGGVVMFILAVVTLRFLGVLILRRVFPALRRKNAEASDPPSAPSEEGLKRLPYESPIRSTGAWGGKTR